MSLHHRLLAAAAGVSTGDPYFSNVSLLLPGDSDYEDKSSNGFTVTAVGDANYQTSVKKFGAGSLIFDGSGDYFTLPTNAAFAMGTGPYTWEGWIYPQSSSGERGIFKTCDASLYGISIWHDGTSIFFQERKDGYDGDNPSITGTIVISAWQYIAMCRETGTSGTLRAFVGGVSAGSVTSNLRDLSNNDETQVGRAGGASGTFHGYIDEVRLTKAVARYTENFTPPTEAFPLS